jgi:hypothetical protein
MMMNDAASCARNWWPLVGAIMALMVSGAGWYGLFILWRWLAQ